MPWQYNDDFEHALRTVTSLTTVAVTEAEEGPRRAAGAAGDGQAAARGGDRAARRRPEPHPEPQRGARLQGQHPCTGAYGCALHTERAVRSCMTYGACVVLLLHAWGVSNSSRGATVLTAKFMYKHCVFAKACNTVRLLAYESIGLHYGHVVPCMWCSCLLAQLWEMPPLSLWIQ